MKKIIKPLLIVLVAGLIGMQFSRPEKNSGGYESVSTFETETMPTAQIAEILKNNCYDCHSDQTQYPWYSEIAPISFWLKDHIDHGKKHFNVAEWKAYSIKKKEHKLEELIEMVENDEMPLPSYTWVHGNLSKEEKVLILQWAGLARLQYKHILEISAN